jgi:mannose-6-phosphate isomerase-like protein (cupin superfamily)
MTGAINLKAKLTQFDDHWSPRTLATHNGQDIMVAKLLGEFPWHSHDDTDDFFLVIHGEIVLELKDQAIPLSAGEMYVVPKGVEHRPIAREDAHVMLIERSGTPNTGDAKIAAPRKLL